jgi:hypothetical protein
MATGLFNSREDVMRQGLRTAVAVVLSLATQASWANYSCTGLVDYLGIDQGGSVVVSLKDSTPTHKICSIGTQGAFLMLPTVCKAAYATLLTAKLSNRSMTVFYNGNAFTCGSLPSWADVPDVYFIQGPN